MAENRKCYNSTQEDERFMKEIGIVSMGLPFSAHLDGATDLAGLCSHPSTNHTMSELKEHGSRILVHPDQHHNLRMLQQMLQSQGRRVEF